MFLPINPKNVYTLLIFSLILVTFPVCGRTSDQSDPLHQTQLPHGPLVLAVDDSESTNNLPSAVVWYLELAEQGDKDAQYNLGSIYETGFGVNVDMKEAVKWYNKAAFQGHQMAQLKLGMMYYLGKGTEQSTIKGNKWIREAAKSGNSLALLLQENVIAHDVDKDIEPQKLISRTLQAFEKGQINAEETLRLELQKIERARKNEAEKPRFAGTVTGSAAKAGTVKNEVPDFLNKNPQTLGPAESSLITTRHRALEGDAKAQYELGRMYETGNQIAENLDEAFKWYTASASQDYTDAQYRLGVAYLYGLGVQQSTVQGGVWLKKARDKLHPKATLLLNSISSNRSGIIDKPHSILLSWYLERSVDGDGEAMLGLGNMFEQGWGIEQDIEVAKKWYAKARAAGTKGAARHMRQMKADIAARDDSQSLTSESATSHSQPYQPKLPVTPSAQREPGANQMQGAGNEQLAGSQISNQGGEQSSGDQGLLGNQTKEYLTPAVLLILGLFMGFLVFRWMKGSNHQGSAY